MEDLLALADDGTVAGEGGLFEHGGEVGDLFVVHADTALLDEPAAFTLGRSQTALHKQRQGVDLVVGEVVSCQLGGWHMLAVAAAAEERLGARLGLSGFFFAVDEFGELESEDLLGLVELAACLLYTSDAADE